jgi:hypothetical protein
VTATSAAPGHWTPPQPSGWPQLDTVAGCGGHHGGQAGHGVADHGGRPRACLRLCPARMPEPARLWPAVTAVPDRVRLCAARVGRSAVAAARATGVHAGGRRAVVGGRTPVRAADRRRHRHGHVCRTPAVRTPAVRRAAVPEGADGQSADGSGSLQLPFLTFKAGPAGGRLRRPSSAGSHHQRSDLPARAAHQLPDVGPDQPNRLGLPHDNRQRDKTGDYQQEKPGPSPVDPFTISVLLHPLILNKQGCGGGASRSGGL